jgi:putative ABC transport system ATP-binding protein
MSSPDNRSFSRPDPVVEARALSKSYREADSNHPVLTGIELTIHPGEFVVLLGKSGSGKSTLLNLISGMDVATSGEVRLVGKPLHALTEEERTQLRRRYIGFVFQSFNLLPTLTVEENVLLPLELNGAPERKSRETVRQLLEKVGLAERRQQYPDRLSGGEQQRVAVARALAHRPLLLLADEPTGNLDAETGRQVLDLFEELARESGHAVLVATHDREMVSRADRVLQLLQGRLMERPKLQAAR